MIAGDSDFSYIVRNPCIVFGTTCVSVKPATSGKLAANLDFWHTSTSHEIESTSTRKLDPENIGVAVGSLSLCALELEICLGAIPPPPVAGKRRKEAVVGRMVKRRITELNCVSRVESSKPDAKRYCIGRMCAVL